MAKSCHHQALMLICGPSKQLYRISWYAVALQFLFIGTKPNPPQNMFPHDNAAVHKYDVQEDTVWQGWIGRTQVVYTDPRPQSR